MAKKWIQSINLKKGALRRQLGVKAGARIPMADLIAAARAKGRLGRRARLALTLRRLGARRG